MSSTLRDMHVGIYFQDNATAAINSINSSMNSVETTLISFGAHLDSVENNIEQLADTGETTSNQVVSGFSTMSNHALKFGDMSTQMLSSLTLGIATLAATGFGALGVAVSSTMAEMDSAFARLEARTGATGNELAGLENTVKNVFKAGFGETIGQVSDEVAVLNSMFSDLNNGELQDLAQGAFTVSELWGAEVKEVGKAVSTMTKTFGDISETQALDLMTTAFRETGDMSDDLLDTFNEYSTQFKALGYDAEGFTATLIAGAKSGAFNFDKLADTAKEGFLKLSEGSKETNEALESMGLDANQITSDIAKGGDAAHQAFMAVSTAIGTIKDPAEQNAAAIAAFGTPLEDLGPQFNTFFSSVNQDLGNFEGSTQRAAEALHSSFGARMTNVWRNIKVGIADVVNSTGAQEFLGMIAQKAEELVPKIEGLATKAFEFGNTIRDNWGPIKETLVGLGTAVVTFVGIMAGMSVVSTVNTLMTAYRAGTLAATLAQMGLNVAMLANPFTWVAAGIAVLVGIGVVLWRNWDTVKAKAEELWAKLRENPMMALVAGPIGAVVAAGVYLYNNWDTIKAKAGELWTTATEKFAGIKQAVSDFVSPAIGWFDTLSGKWNDFKTAISNFKMPEWMSKIGGTIGSGIDKVKSWTGADGSHATGLANVPFDGYCIAA